jgi:colicin import membrane protein
MPIRERIGAGVVISMVLFGATACNDDEEQARKLAEVQHAADEKLKKAEVLAAEKVKGLEKQIEDLKTEAAKLKSEAEQAIGKAQQNAEDQQKAAEEALKKAREAYKAEGRAELAALNKQLQELQGKIAKAPAKVKPAIQKSMKDVAKQQQEIGKDIAAFDQAALDQLATAKAKLRQDLAKLKGLIAGIKAKAG